MRVRGHRELLTESMAIAREVNTKEEFINYFSSEWMRGGTIVVNDYHIFDERIGWQTFIVCHRINGKNSAIGFADGPAPEEWGEIEVRDE